MWETRVRSQGREDPLEKELATHSSILACRSPWTEPGRLQSTGSQRQTRCARALSLVWLWDRMNSSLPGSSVHRTFQARILEWAAFPFPEDLPDPGIQLRWIQLRSLEFPALAGGFFTSRRLSPGSPCFQGIPSQINTRVQWGVSELIVQGKYRAGFVWRLNLGRVKLKNLRIRRTCLVHLHPRRKTSLSKLISSCPPSLSPSTSS